MILHLDLDGAGGSSPAATAARAMIVATLASATATSTTASAVLFRFCSLASAIKALAIISAAAVIGAEVAITAASWRPWPPHNSCWQRGGVFGDQPYPLSYHLCKFSNHIGISNFTSAMAFAAAATQAVTTETRQWSNLLRYWRQWLLGRLRWQKCKFRWELIQPCVLWF